MNSRAIAAAVLGHVFLFFSAEAKSLVWSVTERQAKAQAGDEKIFVSYPFKNDGADPVRIVSVTTTCICTTGTPGKDVYGPGEEGELKVRFDIGPQVGRQERSIVVVTDDAPQEPAVLKIIVDISEPILVQPKLLFWKIGEPLEDKAVLVTAAEPSSSKPIGVRPASSSFSSRLEKVDDAGHYRVWLKPDSTAKPLQAVFYIDAEVGGAPHTFAIFAAVK